MTCKHDGYRGLSSKYDRRRGVLAFVWTCERCGTRLNEAQRVEYRPHFEPNGNAPFVSAAR